MRYWLVWGAIVLLDQATKGLAMHLLIPFESRPVIPPVLRLTLVHNTGAAFGLFAGRSAALGWATLGLLALVVVLWNRLRSMGHLMGWGIVVTAGGAVGNLIDRLRFGYVIDFVDLGFWPVFNGADAAVILGTGLMVWSLLRQE